MFLLLTAIVNNLCVWSCDVLQLMAIASSPRSDLSLFLIEFFLYVSDKTLHLFFTVSFFPSAIDKTVVATSLEVIWSFFTLWTKFDPSVAEA